MNTKQKQKRTNHGSPAANDNAGITENSQLLTGGEVSKQLRICRHTLRRWEQAGKIKGIRFGRRVIRFRLAEVKRLIEEAT
jgi:excisionase family DNA binding protein